jgi:hypothetical protein
MNTLRTNLILPNSHKILITPYWLLGFIVGDGSFSVSTSKSFPLRFNIVQSIIEKKNKQKKTKTKKGSPLASLWPPYGPLGPLGPRQGQREAREKELDYKD